MKPFATSRVAALGAALGLALLPLLAGCAARGAGSGGTFERDVGVGSQRDVVQQVEWLLNRYQFEVVQKSTTPPLFWETRWRSRAPYTDEQELGVAAAQVRLLVRARQRGGETGLGPLYNVNVTVENRVQRLGSADWDPTVATATYREWATEVVEAIRERLDVGIRVFDPQPPCCAAGS